MAKNIADLTDEQILEAVEAYRGHGSITAAAKVLDIERSTFRHRIQRGYERGLIKANPLLPGFRVTKLSKTPRGDYVQQKPEHGDTFRLPDGHTIKGISALVDPDQRVVQQWIKTKRDQLIDWPALFRSAFSEFEGRAPPITPPNYFDDDILNLFPCNDWHINLLTWAREVGENWDLKIAERTIGSAVEDAIMRTRSASTAIVLGGGDLMHNDDNTNRTAKSGNVLEADGRHQKGIEVAQRLMIQTIDAALRNNKKVIVRVLAGNHDEYSSVAITYFLSAWYRNEPRVFVDLDASLFFWHRFGHVMIGATHGHTVKLDKMASIMAHRRAEDWGLTKFRYVHGFHVHHNSKIATEGNGVIAESHEAPIPQDAWHFGSGYLSGRAVKTITYHRDFGEVSRVKVAIVSKALERGQ